MRTDVIGRTGGEEFLALLPGTHGAVELTIAERLSAAVEQLELSDVAPSLRDTLSIGLTESSPDDRLKVATSSAVSTPLARLTKSFFSRE